MSPLVSKSLLVQSILGKFMIFVTYPFVHFYGLFISELSVFWWVDFTQKNRKLAVLLPQMPLTYSLNMYEYDRLGLNATRRNETNARSILPFVPILFVFFPDPLQ